MTALLLFVAIILYNLACPKILFNIKGNLLSQIVCTLLGNINNEVMIMLKKVVFALILVLLSSFNISAKDYANVEVYDFKKEKVVKVVESNSEIEKEAVNYLNSITGLYPKFSPIPKEGHAVKIPLIPLVKIENKWLKADVDQVIVVFPKDDQPFLLVFDSEDRLMSYLFNGDANKLLKLVNYDIKYTD
jgi:hypothetical protein